MSAIWGGDRQPRVAEPVEFKSPCGRADDLNIAARGDRLMGEDILASESAKLNVGGTTAVPRRYVSFTGGLRGGERVIGITFHR